MTLPIVTIADIRSWGPCYDPVTDPDKACLPEGWQGTALTILENPAISAVDKLWAVCRKQMLDDRTLRFFAVRCARRALALIPEPDPRSVAACDIAERFANGNATEKELDAAWAAAADADADAAWAAAAAADADAARAAAWAAADAARAAARAAARDAAWAAADAARAATWAAARDAARAAARAAARDAARAAAWAAAADAQTQILIELIKERCEV